MKSINISGTTSEVFRIGEGNNAVDLRVIQGKLYFRNFGDTFKELLSNDADITLSPINWAPNNNYSVGDLIYYQQSLFQVIANHISSSQFIYSNNYYRRISNINNITKIEVNSYLNNITSLTILSSNFIYLYGSGTGSFTLKMPDPTSIGLGSQYLIQNNSSKEINIYTNNNILITTINPNENKIVVFLDYNSSDFWTSMSISTDLSLNLDTRKIIFNNNQSYKFIGASGIFLNDRAGKYSFFDSRDSDLNGDIFWATGGNDCKVITFSDKIVSGDSPNNFCFFNINNDLYLKNNTGITKEIVFQSLY
jgi:hypothetical protein